MYLAIALHQVRAERFFLGVEFCWGISQMATEGVFIHTSDDTPVPFRL